jgi:hypothetical protein
MRKAFDKTLFAKNDTQARKAATDYLLNKGFTVQDNPDKYGPDLIATRNGKTKYIEVEIKQVFKGGKSDASFPFDSVQLPERKSKYRKYEGIEFWILSKDLRWAMVIPGDSLKWKRPKIVSNKYCRWGEKFYQVPLAECELTFIGEDT